MSDKTKKIILYSAAGLLLATAAVLWTLNTDGNEQPLESTTGSSPLDNDTSPEEQPSMDDPNVPDVKEEVGEGNQTATGQNTNYKPVISRISQDGSNVYIKAYVSTFHEGTCKLEMTKDSSQVFKSSGVTPQPSYLQCSGFIVHKSELSSGNWRIKVIYEFGGNNYESDGQDFNVS